MGLSCSDFTDGVLEIMGEFGFLREEDVPNDDPGGQLRVASAALQRVGGVHEMAVELAKKVLEDGLVSNELASMAQALIRASELIAPPYLVCDGYDHIFDGNKTTQTRWVMDLRSGEMVAAQFFDGSWKNLRADDVRDLMESVRDANDVRSSPGDFGAETADEIPKW